MNTDDSIYEVVESSVKITSNANAAMTTTTFNSENVHEYSKPATSAVGIHGSNDSKEASTKRLICIILAVVSVIATLALIAGCFVAVFVEIASIKTAPQLMANDSSIMLHLNQLNQTIASIEERLLQLNRQTTDFYQQLAENLGQLRESNDEVYMQLSQNITKNTEFYQQLAENLGQLQESNDDVYMQLSQNITELRLRGHFLSNPATSCTALPPSSPSGYYWLKASNGSAVRVYCDMTRLCGNGTGVWTRVAHLNMTADHQCPGTLMQNNTPMACVVNHDEGGCSSVTYPTFLPYSKICGKILAHSTGTPDGFGKQFRSGTLTLDSNYVDGVSLTRGHPRQHIWSFAADIVDQNCLCLNSPPSFLNNEHFFCADRSRNPAWDGINGCHTNNPPWFHRELSALTTDNIEMRICRDEERSNEDIGITHIELYIQ